MFGYSIIIYILLSLYMTVCLDVLLFIFYELYTEILHLSNWTCGKCIYILIFLHILYKKYSANNYAYHTCKHWFETLILQ